MPKGHVFDEYPYADGKMSHFCERYRNGELDKKAAGWVNPSDFEDAVPCSNASQGTSDAGRTQSRSIASPYMSLRAERSNLPCRELRLPRRCAPRNDMAVACPTTLHSP